MKIKQVTKIHRLPPGIVQTHLAEYSMMNSWNDFGRRETKTSYLLKKGSQIVTKSWMVHDLVWTHHVGLAKFYIVGNHDCSRAERKRYLFLKWSQSIIEWGKKWRYYLHH